MRRRLLAQVVLQARLTIKRASVKSSWIGRMGCLVPLECRQRPETNTKHGPSKIVISNELLKTPKNQNKARQRTPTRALPPKKGEGSKVAALVVRCCKDQLNLAR